MIWDSPLTRAVARELDALLRGTRLRGHRFRWEDRELSLFFREGTLKWSLHPEEGWLIFGPPVDPPDDARPLSAQVVGVEAIPDERYLRFRFKRVRGRKTSVQVIVELMTNQWNALLVDGADERIRHLLWTRRSGDRALAVGQAYHPPAPSTRAGTAEALTRDQWDDLTSGATEDQGLKALLERVAFTSPVNLQALADPASGYPLWLGLRSLDSLRPCVLESTRGKQPYPIVLPIYGATEFPTLLAALEAVVTHPRGQVTDAEAVLERLERTLYQAEGKVRGIQQELDRGEGPEETREKANLLLARLGQIRRGSSRVVLTGFRGEEVELELDPSRSPHENAEALYEEAARLDRARRRLPPLLEKARAKVSELTELRKRILAGEITPEEAGHRLPKARRKWKAPQETPDDRLPFKRYLSSGGLEIRVGRGSRDNDALTFRHARPDDIWLHARDASGAHVVLRWSEKGNPPARDLTEAAVLAALYSRARSAGVVPVDWTRRKHVRKPRKAGPGTVLPDRIQTLFVEPDPELPKRLSQED